MLQPMPMYGTSYVFSKPFFRFWTALTFLWAFGAALTITFLPLWEGRKTLMMFWLFITGKRSQMAQHTEGVHVHSGEEHSSDHAVVTPSEKGIDHTKDVIA